MQPMAAFPRRPGAGTAGDSHGGLRKKIGKRKGRENSRLFHIRRIGSQERVFADDTWSDEVESENYAMEQGLTKDKNFKELCDEKCLYHTTVDFSE